MFNFFCAKFLLWNTMSFSTYACIATYSWFFWSRNIFQNSVLIWYFFLHSPIYAYCKLNSWQPFSKGSHFFLSWGVDTHFLNDNFVVHNGFTYLFRVWHVCLLNTIGKSSTAKLFFTAHDFADFSHTPSPLLHFFVICSYFMVTT